MTVDPHMGDVGFLPFDTFHTTEFLNLPDRLSQASGQQALRRYH
jgi:hypothetical protein